MTMQETHHPIIITRTFDDLFIHLELSQQALTILRQFISLTLPFYSQDSIQTCAEALLMNPTWNHPFDKEDLKQALSQFYHSQAYQTLTARGTRYKISHPLATAIHKVLTICRSSADLPHFIELLFELSRHDSAISQEFDASTYYNHLLCIRDVLIHVHAHYDLLKSDTRQTVRDLIYRLNTYHSDMTEDELMLNGFSINKTANLCQKLHTVISIDQQTWTLGHKQRTRKVSTNSSVDSTPVASRTKPTAPQTSRPISETLYASALVDMLHSENQQRKRSKIHQHRESDHITAGLPKSRPPVPSKAVIVDESIVDSNKVNSFQLTVPTALITNDEKRTYIQRQFNRYAAINVISQSDMQRLSYYQVIEQLILLATYASPLLVMFTYLCFSTGMEPERLSTLTITQSRPEQDSVFFNPETSRLTYGVLNSCAVPLDQHRIDVSKDDTVLPDNHIMVLIAPSSVADVLLSSQTATPFSSIQNSFTAAKKMIKRETGKTINSFKRFQASAHVFDQGSLNLLERAYKQGNISFNEGASSAYRSIDLTLLNQKHQESTALAVELLKAEWTAHKTTSHKSFPAYLEMDIHHELPSGRVGSIRYHDVTSVRPLVQAIKNHVKQLKQQLDSSQTLKTLNKLIKLMNLQHLMYWLIVQIHSLGRPLGNTTNLGLINGFLWCSDKQNHAYRERKFLPVCLPKDLQHSLLTRQQLAIKDSYHAFASLMKRLSIVTSPCNDVIHPHFSLPHAFTLVYAKPSHKNRDQHAPYQDPPVSAVKVQLMGRKAFTTCLQDLGLADYFQLPTNLFRHVASSELAMELSDACVDEALGHKHAGRDMWGLESSANSDDLYPIIKHITHWVESMELNVIDFPETIFERYYDRR